MAAVDTVFEQLGSMTVLELVELKNKIEEEWGITAAAPVAVAAPAGGGDGAAAAEEKTAFDVVLTGAGQQKIQVIKVVRAVTGPRPEGGQGPRRLGPQAGQGGRGPGRGRLDQEPAGRGRRGRRDQVTTPFTACDSYEAGLPQPGLVFFSCKVSRQACVSASTVATEREASA